MAIDLLCLEIGHGCATWMIIERRCEALMAAISYSETDLVADMKAWWDDEVASDSDPFAVAKPATGTIFDALPAIDSLGAINVLLTIEKHVGFEVTARIIRPGGYNSFDEMASDLTSKARALAEKRARSPKLKEAA